MKLLISVTSAVEAEAARVGGADIIDVKNPAEGALGAASVSALQSICAALPPQSVVSAALGESNSAPGVLALAAYGAATFGLQYVKLGLLTPSPTKAVALLQQVQAALNLAKAGCALIAVGYADAAEVDALPWQALPEVARAAGLHGCMLDTALKDGRGLFNHIPEADLTIWLAECRAAGLCCALAGSLRLADLPALRRLRPDIAGFRGAACHGDRINGQVQAALVAELGLNIQPH